MPQREHFNVLVLGSGQGGQLIAWHLAQAGQRTALIERRWVGGSCPNIACMPSKTELWSARVAHFARHGQPFGVTTGGVTIDMPTVLRHKREMVRHEVELHRQNFTATGTELIIGHGRFLAPKTLEVSLDSGTRILTGDQVFLNLGTQPAIPPITGLKDAGPMTHIHALELDYVPAHLIILGGGYVGIEMAQAYRRFGSRVTIIQAGPRLLDREDFDVADEMQRIIGDEGIQVLTGANVVSVRGGRSGDRVSFAVRKVSLDSGTRILTGDQVFLNLGTQPAIPPITGLKDAGPMTHIHALELDYVPAHLIILGGGYVGIEMAQAYRRFGSRVTIIQAGPRLLDREDFDVADEMQRIIGDEGIQVLTGANVVSVRGGRSGDRVSFAVRTSSGELELEGSDILVAAGRVPNTAGIGLEVAGVDLDARGYIRVNERLETTASDVWAIGECAGSPHFTHVSVDDFRIIKDSLAGGSRTTRDRLVPYCLFTDPQLAHVGLTEREAEGQGIALRVARLPMSTVLRTHTTDETRGFMKALIGSDDRVLGFTMIGSEAGEVMTAVQTAMLAGLPYQRLRDAVIAHLTMAEGLGPLLANVPPR